MSDPNHKDEGYDVSKMTKWKLEEVGFGRYNGSGMAKVMSDINGNPLKVQPLVMHNGYEGARVFLVKKEKHDPRNSRSYYLSQNVFYITVDRKSEGSAYTAEIQEIDTNDFSATKYQARFFLQYDDEGNLHFDFAKSESLERNAQACDLIADKLNNAIQAAVRRSLDTRPDKIYFGIPADDATEKAIQEPSKRWAKPEQPSEETLPLENRRPITRDPWAE